MDGSFDHEIPLHLPAGVGVLPDHWTWKRLDAVCLGIFDCPHSTPTLTAIGPLLARSQDIRSGVFRIGEAAHVSNEAYAERISRAEPIHGDLLYSREGTYFGIAAEVPPDTSVCLGQRMVLLRPNPDGVNFRYLRYWLNSPVLSTHLQGHRDGSVAERLNMPTIRAIPVLRPPLPEQRAIARILGALDDKIELNRRMNATLEALARALFTSWFVDFDPVRAKAEGRQPAGMDAATAALFPDGFEALAIGPIPRGWRVGPIGEEVRVVGGSTPRTDEPAYWDGGTIHWATPKDLALLEAPALLGTERRITDAGLAQISSGLLPAGTLLMSSRAPIGYLAIAEVPVAINQGFIAMVCERALPNVYVLHWASANMGLIKARANGTTFLEISKASFRPIRVLVPPSHVLAVFMARASEWHRLIVSNLRQSRTLAAIRDALLPKLLSGAVRVGDAEKVVEEVIA
jgi:type I restriction enzyme S subunit